MKRPYIVYSLTKERTTQKFSRSKFAEILKGIDSFLQKCTTTNINEPGSVALTAYTAYDETDPKDALIEIIGKTTERFGPSDQEPIAYHYPSGEPHSTIQYTWKLPNDRLQELIQYIIDSSPMPKSNFGPLQIFFTYDFKLIDPISKDELQNQEHVSDLLIWFSRSKSCSPTLFFPFEQADRQFWNYIDSIIPFLPFKLEEKYLKLAHVNKQGEIKSFKKIQRPNST